MGKTWSGWGKRRKVRQWISGARLCERRYEISDHALMQCEGYREKWERWREWGRAAEREWELTWNFFSCHARSREKERGKRRTTKRGREGEKISPSHKSMDACMRSFEKERFTCDRREFRPLRERKEEGEEKEKNGDKWREGRGGDLLVPLTRKCVLAKEQVREIEEERGRNISPPHVHIYAHARR